MSKLIVLDLDGTLLNNNSEVSEYSKKCLNEYERLGHMVVLASQKNYGEMNSLHTSLNLHSPIICEGGSELYFYNDSISDIVMSIDIDTLKEIFKENFDYIISAFYHYKTNLFIHKRLDILTPLYGINSTTVIHKNNFLNMDLIYPNMIFMVIDVNHDQDFLKNMEKYKEYIELTTLGKDLTHALYYMNIKHVNKAYATLELMMHTNYKLKDLIAVGDSLKDRNLLKLPADTCAMINGEDEAKEVAKYISEFDNNNDGAVRFVNKILNIEINKD